MARLPEAENYDKSPDKITRYYESVLDIRRTVLERRQAAKLPVKSLNDERKIFTKNHGLYTPGLDFVLKLEFDFTAHARQNWLDFFDAGRAIRGLDRLTAEQLDLLEAHDREVAADVVANSAA